MRWFVAIVLCCAAAPRASTHQPLVVQALNNTRIDKLAIVHEQLWAAGDGQVFIYKNSKWVAPFKSNGQGEAFAIGAVTTVSANRTIMRDNASTNLGIVCFSRDRGLCSVYDPQTNRSFVLDENQARDFAAPGALLSLLQDHARGSPLMMAVNQNVTPVNEVPLQLAELSNEEYLARTKSDAIKLSLKPYSVDNRRKNDPRFSIRFRGWKPYFPPVHYLYSFQHNGFVYIVTVQPAVDSESFRYDTRIARFCLRDETMTTYTEIPVRCKTSLYTFEVAVHARMVNHKSRFLLFMSMGNADQGERYSKDKSALCVFDIEELDKKFELTINDCNSGAPEVGVRKIKYYQDTTRSSEPLACERLDRRIEFCSGNRQNKFIISMTEYEGEVVYANVRKMPLDVTYIYGATRVLSAPVGVLTAFEIDPPGSPTSDEPLYIWATDHRGRLHRILYMSKSNYTNISESMLLVSVNRPVAKDGFAIESAQYNNRTMFVVDKTLIEVSSPDPCSLYLNCGDCLNPRALTHKIVSCVWENDRCVHSTDEAKADNAFCKPTILEKSPFNGPQRGGTRFRIKGFDLGDQESARVMFGNQKCRILTWDNMTGICEVPPDRDSKTKVDITLYVADHRHDARMKTFPIGTDGPVNLGTFTYYSVEFYGVHPSFGPRKGGTQLRIIGQNIGQSGPLAQYGLIGSNVEHLICKDFVLRNESELWCNTTEYFGPDPESVNSLNLVLKIDGVAYTAVEKPDSSQLFVYQPNPKAIKVHPETKTDFFAKGSISYPIVFTGEHLDSAAFPKIQLKLLGHPDLIEESCIANATCMRCRVPALNSKAISDQPLPATTTLKIDDFKYEVPGLRITYYPNATIILSDGEKFVIDSDGPSKISIRGKNLRPLEKEDVRITINDNLCSIGNIEENSVECYSAALSAGEYSIQVEVGGKKYSALMSTIVTAGRGLSGAATAAIVIGSLIVLVGLTFLLLRYVPLRKKFIEEPAVQYTPENDGYLRPDNDRNAASDNERLLPTIPPDPDIINLLSEEGLLMDFSCIQVGVLIGRGQFGCVYRGILKRDKLSEEEPVAVKTLQQRGLTSNDANVFLKEALRMKDFNHQNVLRLIGVSFDNNNSTDPMIIVPYMANGDLLTYIRNQDNKPTVKDLITFGANIALGMSYLTTQKFVHRDLAARNCMLGLDLIVRVADFGLSRDVYETSYYSSDNTKTKLPVKWMAIESLKEGVYSHKSDVWSYGVVLWELMTRGCVPLPNVDNWEVQNWLISGRRMLQPTFCPDALYQIMMACWDEDPKKRPTFSQLVKDVPNVIHTIELASRNRIPNYVNV